MARTQDVEVKQSQMAGVGRGLFATKDFAPGDLVLCLERPLVAELELDRMQDTCAWCLQRGLSDPTERMQAASMGLPGGFIEVKCCTACRKVAYCSKACQAKAWKREHKYECKILKSKERPDLPVQVRAIIKLLGKLMADPEGKTDDVYDVLKFMPAGAPNGLDDFAKENKQRFDDFNMLGHAAWHYCGAPKLPVVNVDSLPTAKALMFNVMSNTFKLTSPLDIVELGKGFDPILCSANHSCDPNVALGFNQPKTVLRALKPIKKGDEIFMKYTETTNPLSVRRTDLQETYFFTCQCAKCQKGPIGPEDTFKTSPEKLPDTYCRMADNLLPLHRATLPKHTLPIKNNVAESRLAAMQAEAFSVAESTSSNIEDIKGALQMCLTSRMWRWTRQPVPELLRRLFGAYLEAGEPYKSFRVGIKLYFEVMPELYPQSFYPDRLIITWTLATITNVLCGPRHQHIYQEMAQSGLDLRVIYMAFLFELHENMPKMYGLDSPFSLVLGNTYKQIMAGVPMPEAEIKEKIKESLPALEMMALSMDVSSL
ncbi:hypothetical protein F5Y15DRAFT_104232 [Xylariaceae sp. FL0016]|nr:hypothetical protein F5Y15DRAFT_104232 [Xylariaceae sp. FL0016]